ncbi:alginate export family protein [Nitrosomonas sp. Is37]|uniref:alginate export family protein n=1 Tax=Nitrosomonas sp. Is37 TaxID=3080535 RepID=UPI00294AF0AF|nr:alginate export family protein [Nitrosomonas sp. Is37]MDV6343955.1 alginate export family protein [Nitrosomonas sp. Is37]
MMRDNKKITSMMICLVIGFHVGGSISFAAEEQKTEAKEVKKSLSFSSNAIVAQAQNTETQKDKKPSDFFRNLFRNGVRPNGPPFNVEEGVGSTRFDFDRLTDLMENHKTPLAAMAPDWLNLAIEHRTRYEVFDNGFTRAIPDGNEQIHQRTRFLFEVKNIIDWAKFTLELTDFRAPLAEHGQQHNTNFADHFDFTQLRLDLLSKDFLGTGYGATFEVGRMILEYGESRLVGGHRWGSFTPTFDGIRFTLGSDKEKWGLQVFGTRPVQREVSQLNWNTPESYFSGVHVTNRDMRWANFDAYWLQLNEGNNLRQRNLSTPGFRLFAKPTRGSLDYEIESMYQFGDTQDQSIFAHRHHGEIGYSFETPWPLRVLYLFDYASGDPNPNKNFDLLFAKRRVEFGPTATFGPFFPSNLFSPVGFRMNLTPIPNVRFMMSHRAYWLADKRGTFVGSALQDPTGRSGSFLGHMLDVSIGWDPQWSFLKRVSFDIGFSHLFKGDFFDKVPNSPGSKDTNFGYTMATIKF